MWKPACLVQLDRGFVWKPGNWRAKFSIKFCKLVLVLSKHVNLQIIMSVLTSVDVGFLKTHLTIDLVPSTSTNYLGSRLELDKVPGNLHALMADILVIFYENSLMFLGKRILQSIRLQQIHSWLVECTLCLDSHWHQRWDILHWLMILLTGQ